MRSCWANIFLNIAASGAMLGVARADPDLGDRAIAQSTTIRDIKIDVGAEIDQARIFSALPFKVGDAYFVSNVEQGLLRLAETGKYQAVESRFDEVTGRLQIHLKSYDTLSQVKINVTGAVADVSAEFLQEDVRDVVRFTAGDAIDLDQLGEIRERVRQRFFERGYRSAKVLVFIDKNESGNPSLSISVETGQLSRVAKLNVQGATEDDLEEFADFLADQKTLKKAIRSFSGHIGEDHSAVLQVPLDWIGFNQALSSWSLKAREDSYYDFKAEIEVANDSETGATVLLTLNRGQQYNLQFKGNTTFWERELRARVLDRTRKLGIPFDLRNAIDRISALYRAKGFANVEIESSAIEKRNEKIIEFHIREGQQFFVGDINFEGVPPEFTAAVNEALAEWLKPSASPFHAPYFDEKLLRSRLPLLIKSIRDRGFLQARFLEFRFDETLRARKINLDIPLQLGPRYAVRSLTLNGNSILSEKEIDKLIDIDLGTPINPTKFFAAVERVAARYRELGFVYVKTPDKEEDVFVTVPELSALDATINIQPGPQVYIGQILVTGLKKTKEKVVTRELRELDLKTQKEWNPYSIQTAEQRLLSLGIFGAAKVDSVGGRIINNGGAASAIEQNERDLKVTVSERAPGTIEFGPGYRTDLGLVAFGEFNYRNLGGWNRQIVLKAQASRKITNYQFIEQQYSATYLEPFFLDDPTRFQINLAYLKEDDIRFTNRVATEGINYEEASIGTALDRQLGKYFRITHNLYKISLPRILRIVDLKTDLDRDKKNNSYRIATIGTLLSFDTRDNLFNPTTGWFTGSSFTYSSPHLGSDGNANFLILRQNISRYFRLGGGPSIALALNYAHLWGIGDTRGVPENVRLALGGRTSIRSLDENQLRDVQPGLVEQRSLELKAEYRQPVLLDFGLAYFVDAGAVDSLRYVDTSAVPTRPCLTSINRAFGCFSYAVGIGVRLGTPVGPLALDFAFNPSPAVGQDNFKVQFNIGSF